MSVSRISSGILPIVFLLAWAATALGDDLPPPSETPVPPSSAPAPEHQPDAAAASDGHPDEHDHPPHEVNPEGDHDHAVHPPHGSLGNVGAKLANPLADLWSISTNWQGPTFFDGDLNTGDPELGGSMVFQPVLPIPLYGKGEKEWRMITRPVLPIIFSQPVPALGSPPSLTNLGRFNNIGGLGDMELPLLPVPPWASWGLPKNLILALGPNFYFPTGTSKKLSQQQFGLGPGLVVGWKTKLWTAVAFPSYFWHIGDRGDRQKTTKDLSRLDLLYAFTLNLPDAWQLGLNPTISYNHRAQKGDRWNVPIGLFGGKTIKVGRTPVNIKVGVEYSVVSEDTFGKRANFRFQITPVIPSLIKKPIFGGG